MSNDLIFNEHNWETRAGGRMLIYVGPHLRESFDREQVAKYVRQRKAFGALWPYDYDASNGAPWYAYVCDTPGYDVETIDSKNSRKTLRRSLERSQVRHIDFEWLAEHGYDTYCRAVDRYSNYQLNSPEGFARHIRRVGQLPGAFALGVFVDDALAAYGIAFEQGQSIRFAAAKFDPEYSSAKPMWALYYTLAHEYLARGFKDVDAGCRPLLHDTNIEEFFRRIGWRQAPCRMDLYLSAPIRFALFVARPLKGLLRRVLSSTNFARLEGLLIAQDVARASRTSGTAVGVQT